MMTLVAICFASPCVGFVLGRIHVREAFILED